MEYEDINDLTFEDDPIGGSDFESDSDFGDDRSGNYYAGDDDDDDSNSQEDNNRNYYQENNEEGEYSDSVLADFLRTKGISDPGRIKFEDENGITEVDWNDLSREEQFNILNQQNSQVDDLDDAELDLINRIRLSRMSVDDYLTLERQKGINAYVNQSQPSEPTYIVDDYSDDDLFMLDLQTKVEDISDDELLQALEAAKANPIVFEKQIQGIRNDYKRLEEEKNERELAQAEYERNEKFQAFSDSVINSINNFTNLGELDITMEDEDANELYDFITGTDAAGINHFYKALNDPDTLTRVAWFALHGEDVIKSISNYYSNAITQANRSGYEKGFNEAKNGGSPSVYINPKKTSKRRNNNISSIDDLTY